MTLRVPSILFSLVVLLLGVDARAEVISDGTARFELTPDGARVCVVFPEPPATPHDCKADGLVAVRTELDRMVAATGAKPVFAATVAHREWEASLVVFRTGATSELSWSAADQQAERFEAKVGVRPKTQLLRVEDVQYARLTMDRAGSDGASLYRVLYVIVADEATYYIALTGPKEHELGLEVIGDDLVGSTRGLSPSRRSTTFAVLRPAGIALAVLSAFVAWRYRRRRRERSERT